MHKLNVVGYRGKSIWAKLIYRFSPKYSHVAVIIDNEVFDTDLLRGVSKRPLVWNKEDYDIIRTYELDSGQHDTLLAFIDRKKGERYSLFECIRYIFKIIGIHIKYDPVQTNCVELITELLVLLGILPISELYEIRSPDEFLNIL